MPRALARLCRIGVSGYSVVGNMFAVEPLREFRRFFIRYGIMVCLSLL